MHHTGVLLPVNFSSGRGVIRATACWHVPYGKPQQYHIKSTRTGLYQPFHHLPWRHGTRVDAIEYREPFEPDRIQQASKYLRELRIAQIFGAPAERNALAPVSFQLWVDIGSGLLVGRDPYEKILLGEIQFGAIVGIIPLFFSSALRVLEIEKNISL
ncbi:hypothetical protein C7212DRAFT_364298 [Tuber magnatum]|uniref:Uncharacterized protein n=1 Tax=Tuber magnatum TaxID=42249 RepID=A0A317SV27_9PEZI|nr:hypothetical protein C7212DRAFT_364298 [Tuber magnatum]